MKHEPIFQQINGSSLKIGVVMSRWNAGITDSLKEACLSALRDGGVPAEQVVLQDVPGAFELPVMVRQLIYAHDLDAVVTIGCLIKGETMHFEYIAEAVSYGLMDISLETGVPVVFGVLTCLTEEQAIARSHGDGNLGGSWAKTAIEMVQKLK